MSVDLTWQKLLYGYSTRLLKFIINLRANTLPSPDDLRRWNIQGTHTCGLCGKENATSNHIFNGCPWVRKQNKKGLLDRHTWRHNNILRCLVNQLWRHTSSFKGAVQKEKKSYVQKFVSAGAKYRARSKPAAHGLLVLADDWRFHVDLPEFVANGSLFDYLSRCSVDVPSLCHMASGIAGGLAHLHMEIQGLQVRNFAYR